MTATLDPQFTALAKEARAWPLEEARRLIKRLDGLKGGADKTVLFETGYGPSGLPHIGTFGEVARTSMVRHAFEVLTGAAETRLICFSDDMDGLRKVPDNVPNKEMLARLPRQAADARAGPVRQRSELRAPQQREAARFPRPVRLRVRFLLATECYSPACSMRRCSDARSLRQGHGHHPADARRGAAARPTRRSCRSARVRARVLQVPMIARDAEGGHDHLSPTRRARRSTTPVTGGHVKCQWKADWAHALDGARHRLRDVRQGSDRQRRCCRRRSAGRWAARRRKGSTTSCSSTTRARRSPRRRATASRSRSG